MAYVFFSTGNNANKNIKSLVFFGLFFSWLGDVLLMQSGFKFFIMGMIAFMFTHLTYAYLFYKQHKLRRARLKEASIAALSMLVISLVLFYFFNKSKEFAPLMIPVGVYMIAISLMAIFAVNMLAGNSRNYKAVHFFVPGAILFVISDGTLAVQKFIFPSTLVLSLIVMISYGIAQGLIAEGFSRTLKG
jgi:uncharacterized membrane protein YhhN